MAGNTESSPCFSSRLVIGQQQRRIGYRSGVGSMLGGTMRGVTHHTVPAGGNMILTSSMVTGRTGTGRAIAIVAGNAPVTGCNDFAGVSGIDEATNAGAVVNIVAGHNATGAAIAARGKVRV